MMTVYAIAKDRQEAYTSRLYYSKAQAESCFERCLATASKIFKDHAIYEITMIAERLDPPKKNGAKPKPAPSSKKKRKA